MQTWRAVVEVNGTLLSVTVQAENKYFAECQVAAQYGKENIRSLMEDY